MSRFVVYSALAKAGDPPVIPECQFTLPVSQSAMRVP